jgi:hypothetical protein
MKTNVKLIFGVLFFIAVVVTIILIVIGVSSSSSGTTTTTTGSTTTTTGSTTTTTGTTTTTTGTPTTTPGTTTTTPGTPTTTPGTPTTTPDPDYKCETRTWKGTDSSFNLSTVHGNDKIKPTLNGTDIICGANGSTPNYCGHWWVWTGNPPPGQPVMAPEPHYGTSDAFCPDGDCYYKKEGNQSQLCVPSLDPKRCENKFAFGKPLTIVSKNRIIKPKIGSQVPMCNQPGDGVKNRYCGTGWRQPGKYGKAPYNPNGENQVCPPGSCFYDDTPTKTGNKTSQICMNPKDYIIK